MIFLIDYDRPTGRLIDCRVFEDKEREKAANARLEIELDLNRRGVDREVVLLEAESEEALRLTHRRYFENVTQILKSSTV
jgi:hypothetical protein